jgi:hypothetical protein
MRKYKRSEYKKISHSIGRKVPVKERNHYLMYQYDNDKLDELYEKDYVLNEIDTENIMWYIENKKKLERSKKISKMFGESDNSGWKLI